MDGEFGRIYLVLVSNISTALLTRMYSDLKVKEEGESVAYAKLLCPILKG
jgi:hypothetical protein